MVDRRDLLKRSRLALRTGETPEQLRVGAVVIFGGASLPVEWLLVAQQESGFLALPVDSAPFVGEADTELIASTGLPRGVVRGGPVLELPAEALASISITPVMTLDAMELDRVLDRWRAAEEGRLEPSTLLQEGEADPARRQWVFELEEERDRLRAGWVDGAGVGSADRASLASGARVATEAGVVDLARARAERTRKGPGKTSIRQLAAAVLLSASVAWVAGDLWHGKRVAELEEELASARSEVARGSVGQPIVEPRVNLPIAWLGKSATVRGEEVVLTLDRDADWVLLVLDAPDGGPSFRLDLRTEEGGKVWSSGGVRPSELGELSLALPSGLFESARYRVLVESEEGGEGEVVEYFLAVEVR